MLKSHLGCEIFKKIWKIAKAVFVNQKVVPRYGIVVVKLSVQDKVRNKTKLSKPQIGLTMLETRQEKL